MMNASPKEKTFNMLFILPALVLFLVFNLYPLLRTLQLSFYQWNGIDKNMVFVGLAQYKHIIFIRLTGNQCGMPLILLFYV